MSEDEPTSADRSGGETEERVALESVLAGMKIHPFDQELPLEAYVYAKVRMSDGSTGWSYRSSQPPNDEELLGALVVQVELLRRELVAEWGDEEEDEDQGTDDDSKNDSHERVPIEEALPGMKIHPLIAGDTLLEAFILVKCQQPDGVISWGYRTTRAPNREELLGALSVQVEVRMLRILDEWESD